MAEVLFIYGPSGHGKSTGARTLPPEDTVYINADRKDLPWRGARKQYKTVPGANGYPDFDKSNYYEPSQATSVRAIIDHFKNDPRQYIVYDTFTHLLINNFVERIKEKSWDKFNDFAKDTKDILDMLRDLPDGKRVVVLGHNFTDYDSGGNKVDKVRTIGKLLDEKIEIPSMFTVVLYPFVNRKKDEAEYGVYTQSNGTNFAKSPMGMFEYQEPNDYLALFEKMHSYYEGD